jgi:hypothetical protein
MASFSHEQREVPMFKPMLARWLAVAAGLTALTVSAQTPAPAPAPGEYRSALDGYQPFTDTKAVPWKESNDTVGRIGGWRAYAKEAAQGQGHGGHAMPAASAPKPAASPAKP